MKFWFWGLLVCAFLAGYVTHSTLPNLQTPLSPLSPERASPQDWVSQSAITVTNEQVTLNIPNARWATFTDTNSMDPLLDAGSNGIQIIPSRPQDLEIGDVITYDLKGKKIIHRIVEKGQDADGYYFIVKGDNNSIPDPQPVRFDQVERVLVAVVY